MSPLSPSARAKRNINLAERMQMKLRGQVAERRRGVKQMANAEAEARPRMQQAGVSALLASGWDERAAEDVCELLGKSIQPDGVSALWAVARCAREAPPVEEEEGALLSIVALPGSCSCELALAHATCLAARLCLRSGCAAVGLRSSERLQRDAVSPLASSQYHPSSTLILAEVPGEPWSLRLTLNGVDVVAPLSDLILESSESHSCWRHAVADVVIMLAGSHVAAIVESVFRSGCHAVVYSVSSGELHRNADFLLANLSDSQGARKGASLEATETHDSAKLVDQLEYLAHIAAHEPGSNGHDVTATSSSSVAISQLSPKRRESMLLHPSGDAWKEDKFRASGPPLYQTATFAQPAATEMGPYDYTRSGNPTRDMLEQHMAELEGAAGSVAYATGMLAISSATRLVPAGGRIVAPDDLYGGTSRLLENVVPSQGVEVVYAKPRDLTDWEAKINCGATGLVIVESPTNPRMQIADIRAICSLARRAGSLSLVDNSVMAPLLQSPLELGADISMTSATKFLAGHADLTGGFLAAKDDDIISRLWFRQNAEGTMLPPFDCWLTLRGLKTMSIRMEKQQDNAMKMAAFLQSHSLVKRVNYPGLREHEGFETHMQQANGPGSILSFETGDTEVSQAITEETALFKITVSFGSTHSLISMPCYMSHASIPESVRAERGLPNNLVRISAGVEDSADLLADLSQAMRKGRAKRQS